MSILPVKHPANRSILRASHYFFYFQPYQVNRLRHLQQTVNGLFPLNPAITVVDLLYAVLWKRVSMLQTCNSLAVLTIIEPAAIEPTIVESMTIDSGWQVNESPPPGNAGVERNIFVCEAEVLSKQSPVGIAQHIRNHICSGTLGSPYEGWLVDSLPQSNSAAVDYPEGLICTTLSLPALQRIDPRYGGWLSVDNECSGSQCFNNQFFKNERSTSTRRVCAINATTQQDGALSIDMQLPRAEIERFKFRYGDGHSVPPEFYEN